MMKQSISSQDFAVSTENDSMPSPYALKRPPHATAEEDLLFIRMKTEQILIHAARKDRMETPLTSVSEAHADERVFDVAPPMADDGTSIDKSSIEGSSIEEPSIPSSGMRFKEYSVFDAAEKILSSLMQSQPIAALLQIDGSVLIRRWSPGPDDDVQAMTKAFIDAAFEQFGQAVMGEIVVELATGDEIDDFLSQDVIQEAFASSAETIGRMEI